MHVQTLRYGGKLPDGTIVPQAHILALVGPSIDVEVGMPAALEDQDRADGADVAQPRPGTAILDTGAEATCLDIRMVGQLGLLRSGTARIIGPTGAAVAPTFDARIRLPAFGLDENGRAHAPTFKSG